MEADMPIVATVVAEPLLQCAPPTWWQRAANRDTLARLQPRASPVVVYMALLAAQMPQVPPSGMGETTLAMDSVCSLFLWHRLAVQAYLWEGLGHVLLTVWHVAALRQNLFLCPCVL